MDGANHYDTDTARWTAKDPIGAAGGDPDWYGYCLDDPVNGVDPAGLKGKYVKDGVMVNEHDIPIGEVGLEKPLIDPIDLVSGAGAVTLVKKGATTAIAKGLAKAAPKVQELLAPVAGLAARQGQSVLRQGERVMEQGVDKAARVGNTVLRQGQSLLRQGERAVGKAGDTLLRQGVKGTADMADKLTRAEERLAPVARQAGQAAKNIGARGLKGLEKGQRVASSIKDEFVHDFKTQPGQSMADFVSSALPTSTPTPNLPGYAGGLVGWGIDTPQRIEEGARWVKKKVK